MGVLIASYDSGYGEEMDVDVDGHFAAEDSVGKKGKKKAPQKEQASWKSTF
jgi:hypothetical protein